MEPNNPLHQTDIHRVLAAEGISNFGSMLSRLAIPWLAALALDATPLQMAILLIADVAAGAASALFLGSWVDRRGKRETMLRADGLRCALLLLMALAVAQGFASFPLLVVVSAVSGMFTMTFELARSAWIAQRVPVADLPSRNAQLSIVGSLSETAAFALGGWFYQALGPVLALALDGLSYAVSALTLRGVQEVKPAPQVVMAKQSNQQVIVALALDAAQGLRAVVDSPPLRAVASIQALAAFSSALFATSYMIYVSRDLAIPTGWLGMIFALGGLGALLGASVAPWMARRWGPGWTMTAGLAAYAIGAALVPTAQSPGGLWVAIALLIGHQIIGDAGQAMHDVHDRTLRQTAVADELLARADAGVRVVGQLATLVGALCGGWVGNAFGVTTVLWIAVATSSGAALIAFFRLAERRFPRRT